jgi:bifunctional non-homologous end joining protein LigD
LADILDFVKKRGLEGVVAKRADSVYQPGKRTGLWSKHRINLGQEFVIGGYTPGTHGIDAVIIGFYRGKDLIYAARVRAGFVPATRRETFAKNQASEDSDLSFCQSARGKGGKVGARANGGKDERLRLATSRGRCKNRFPGMDGSGPFAAHQICGPA